MEETVILNFEVDQSKAESQLKKVEGLILDNRKAQQELTKAYKQGTITQEEYIDENLRLQQNLKKEQDQKRTLTKLLETESNSRNAIRQRVSALVKEYDNLNTATATGIKRADQLEKEIAQLNAQLTKGDKAAGLFKNQIGNYPQQFQQAAQSINIAGTSIGGITSQLASFATPAGAAIGLVTALGAAYAKSSRGAKDLEFAQSQVSFALQRLSNDFANLFSSAEDGEGILTKYVNTYLTIGNYTPIGQALKLFGIDLKDVAEQSKELALIVEQLEDLTREETKIRGENSERLEQNQELLELIADEQQSINDRIKASNEIEQNLRDNKIRTLYILNQQLLKLKEIEEADLDNEKSRDARLDKEAQIRRESAALEKQITKINKQQDDLNAKLAKEVELRRKAAAAELQLFGFEVREANAPDISLANETAAASGVAADPVIEASKLRQEQYIKELKTVEFTEKQKREFFIESAEIQQQIDRQTFQAALDFAAGLAGLFKEQTLAYKVFASAETILSTYSAATKAYEAAFTPPTAASPALGAAYAGLAIANGLANLAKINGVGFAKGGWTGPGDKYDVAGVVHADEYVVPKSVNNSPAAQPHLAALERMRGGYADGGFVANRNTAPAQQALIMANALKNLPVPVVSVAEVTRVQNRIHARERVSTLRP